MLIHVSIKFVGTKELNSTILPLTNEWIDIRKNTVLVFHFNTTSSKVQILLHKLSQSFQQNMVPVRHDMTRQLIKVTRSYERIRDENMYKKFLLVCLFSGMWSLNNFILDTKGVGNFQIIEYPGGLLTKDIEYPRGIWFWKKGILYMECLLTYNQNNQLKNSS